MDKTHGEFWHAEERADVYLVESVVTKTVGGDYSGRTVDVPVWEIQWHYQSLHKEDDLEIFPTREEAMARWMQLIAQNGVSP